MLRPASAPGVLKFLKRLDEEFPEDLKLHVVMDNYGTHKHPRVQTWVQRHPRFIPHFVPTSSSWLTRGALVWKLTETYPSRRLRQRGRFEDGDR
jgi:transposase